MNIFSGSNHRNGLAAALTNPTELSFRKGRIKEHYPVSFEGVEYPDAEAAYQALKDRFPSEAERDHLMARIIAAKFAQHPALHDAVSALGGTAYLATCEHFTYAKSPAFRAWEGKGRDSRFIRCLIAGFELA